MYTQCPDCLSIYRVGADELGAGRGSFRCGQCGTLFDALPTLVHQLPLDLSAPLPRHMLRNTTPVLSQPIAQAPSAQADLFEHLTPTPANSNHPVVLPKDWAAALGTEPALQGPQAPHLFTEKRVEHRTGPLLWINLALALSLLLQLAIAERAWLTQQAWFRVVATPVLSALGHELGPLRDHSALQLLDRDVRPHPVVPGALLISASIRNRQNIAVSFPLVEVRLTDIDGKVHALRRFAPAEYLGDPEQSERGLTGGALLPLVFEVVDPGQDALNFEFRFL